MIVLSDPSAYSFVFTVERASDYKPADLAGAGADLIELAVAHDPPRWVIVDVTISAKDLYGVECDLGGLLGAVEDDARAVLGAHVARVARARSVVQVRPARVQGRVHVCHFALDELEVCDGLAELLPLV